MNDLTKLSSNELDRLVELNRRLRRIEDDLIKEARAIHAALAPRVKDQSDWLTDYEIDLEVSFHLEESDPKFDREGDNIVAQFSDSLKLKLDEKKIEFGIGDRSVHRNFDLPKDHPLALDRHCYLFHVLYDDKHLSWRRMAKIGRIWTDIVVRFQHNDRGQT